MTTPAPEPVEVAADELAAAEDWTGLMTPETCETAFDPMTAQIRKLSADLARALPVVEAAGALVEKWSEYGPPVPSCEQTRLSQLLDALARAYRAAREPRTGEGTK